MSLAGSVVLADRYEALRDVVLTRSTSGHRHGLALLLREGMAAWISAWAGCAGPPASDPSTSSPRSGPLPTSAESNAWIQLLASMALSILEQVPS